MMLRIAIFFVAAFAAFHLFADHLKKIPAVAEAHPLSTPRESTAPQPASQNPVNSNNEQKSKEIEKELERKKETPRAGTSTSETAAKAIPLDSKYDYQLQIPAIGLNAPVLGLGKTADGSKMAVPDNFTEVSWYNLGPRPGQIGNSVLGAHVDNGGSIPGPFKRLKELNIGDTMTMTDQSGKIMTFKVSEKKIYDYRTKDTGEVFGSNGKPRIVLITCFGTFLPAENTYDKRIVIFASLIKD